MKANICLQAASLYYAFFRWRNLQNGYLRSLWTFTAWTFQIFDLRSFLYGLNIALNVASVNEKFLAAVVWSNEAKAFLLVEKLDCTF